MRHSMPDQRYSVGGGNILCVEGFLKMERRLDSTSVEWRRRWRPRQKGTTTWHTHTQWSGEVPSICRSKPSARDIRFLRPAIQREDDELGRLSGPTTPTTHLHLAHYKTQKPTHKRLHTTFRCLRLCPHTHTHNTRNRSRWRMHSQQKCDERCRPL